VDERHNGERAEGGKEKSHAEIHCRFNHAKAFGLTPRANPPFWPGGQPALF
jgi:hypothetical protein